MSILETFILAVPVFGYALVFVYLLRTRGGCRE